MIIASRVSNPPPTWTSSTTSKCWASLKILLILWRVQKVERRSKKKKKKKGLISSSFDSQIQQERSELEIFCSARSFKQIFSFFFFFIQFHQSKIYLSFNPLHSHFVRFIRFHFVTITAVTLPFFLFHSLLSHL